MNYFEFLSCTVGTVSEDDVTFQGSFKRHEFRCRRGLNLHQEIESFADEFFDREKMKSLGWVEAESIDGTGCKTFEELREKVTLTPQAALLTPTGWPKVPSYKCLYISLH